MLCPGCNGALPLFPSASLIGRTLSTPLPLPTAVSMKYTSAPGENAPLVSYPSARRLSTTTADVKPVGMTTILVPPLRSTGESTTSLVPATAHDTCAPSIQPSTKRSHPKNSRECPEINPNRLKAPTSQCPATDYAYS